MQTDVIITLEQLHCIHESDDSGHSEPYLWPVLIWIDTTNGNVNTADLVLGNARIVIDYDMRAGQTVIIPASVNTLRVRLGDNPQRFTIILSVVLWEEDETPEKAMRAGFNAYSSELGEAIRANLLQLQAAQGSPEAEKAVKKIIEDRVKDKVKASIKGALTTSQKARVFLGTLDLDDVVGSDSESLGSVGQTAMTKPFTLAFSNPSGSESYEIRGNMATVPVLVDPCQAQVDAVRNAQAAVNDIKNAITALQEELQHAGGQNKPAIIAQIAEARQELSAADSVLQNAKRALQTCRQNSAQPPVIGSPVNGVFIQ